MRNILKSRDCVEVCGAHLSSVALHLPRLFCSVDQTTSLKIKALLEMAQAQLAGSEAICAKTFLGALPQLELRVDAYIQIGQ